MSGSGGDSRPLETDAAWFLSGEKVSYCIEQGPDFEISTLELDQEFKAALTTWKTYLSNKRVDAGSKARHLDLTWDYEKRPKCDGTEDLALYFGTLPQKYEEYRSEFHRPTAFIHRRPSLPSSDKRSGIAWFSAFCGWYRDDRSCFPDWRNRNLLRAYLLHEVGHMLGIQHVPKTIMSEDLTHEVQAGYLSVESGKALLGKIDHSNELIVDWSYDFRASGWIPEPEKGDDRRLFKTLTGKDPKGQLRARLDYRTAGERPVLIFQVRDEEKTFELPIELKLTGAGGHRFEFGSKILARTASGPEWSRATGPERDIVSKYFVAQGTTRWGTLRSPSGKSFAALFTRNSSFSGPFALEVVVDDEPRPAFFTRFGDWSAD